MIGSAKRADIAVYVHPAIRQRNPVVYLHIGSGKHSTANLARRLACLIHRAAQTRLSIRTAGQPGATGKLPV